MGRDDGGRVDQLDLVLALELLLLLARRHGRDGLEAPFLIGDPPEGMVAVVDDLFLPAAVLLLPSGPELGGLCGDLVGEALLAVGGDAEALAVEERAVRGQGEEVDTHDGGRGGCPVRARRRSEALAGRCMYLDVCDGPAERDRLKLEVSAGGGRSAVWLLSIGKAGGGNTASSRGADGSERVRLMWATADFFGWAWKSF